MEHQFACPYCFESQEQLSDDHIFPAGLSGSRTIRACKHCNDNFGHGFEALALRQIQNLQVYIGTWGISFHQSRLVYRKGYEQDGTFYDLSNTPGGVSLRLSKPAIQRDESGKITGGLFATEEEVHRFGANLVRKGLANGIRVEPLQPVKRLSTPTVDFKIDYPLKRLALKMCTASVAAMTAWKLMRNPVLHEEPMSPMNDVPIMYDKVAFLDRLRPALAHLIYIEADAMHAYGIVQFFGVLQVYCELPLLTGPALPEAFVGVLDPISGHEAFEPTPTLRITAPPRTLTIEALVCGMQEWLSEFTKQGIARGATSPPTLTANVKTNVVFDTSGSK
jgi:hypothetical protein